MYISCSAKPKFSCPNKSHVGLASLPKLFQKRDIFLSSIGLAFVFGDQRAQALPGFKKDLNKGRARKIPESAYEEGPSGLKVYDVKVGEGQLAEVGRRVVVHYEAKWRGVTFMTSRQGIGVTGGTPLGFDLGTPSGTPGSTLTGLDLGVRGMRVGGRRKLLVPPELAYGDKGIGEVPPNATLEFDVELLSIKNDARGFQVKLVEG
eukprot:TRINITY_DN27718_c1_g3_i2.p1 TRINITY_DN27718_c1_g3~~TRINITY_DN27718_c1_g3_i2.p1  ORF type:complete len:205 (-),score=33.03 TRINITY_DN27718_c1_g3_i2:119-733(-)